MMHLRRATKADARALADLLNALIATGGTTAMTEPLSRSEMSNWIGSNPAQSAVFMAEDDSGTALGFQSIEPHAQLPSDTCNIATFTRSGKTQLGIGSALFEHSRKAARALGYRWVNATVLLQNEGGLIYYKSRGFEPYRRTPERLFMRYDLR